MRRGGPWARGPGPRFLLLAVAALAVPGCATPGADPPTGASGGAEPCPLAGAELDWSRDLLEAWRVVGDEILERSASPLPWIVLFDGSCVWHLAPHEERLAGIAPDAAPVSSPLRFDGAPVPLRAYRHGGRIVLPSGAEIPAAPYAAASIHGDGETFLALAMAPIWRDVLGEEGAARIGSVERFFLGVAAHELVHTLQLPDVAARVRALGEAEELPENMDDDVVEREFGDDPAYVELFRREMELFRRAARDARGEERRALAREGLALARERRARFFVGDRRVFAPLEEIFLTMEGVAIWTHYRLHRLRPDLVAFRADGGSSWSQEEGFHLFLLVDALVPGWRGRVLGPELASPFDLLEEGLAPPRRPDG